jgi:hypothetical protein
MRCCLIYGEGQETIDCRLVSGDFTPVLAKHTKSFNLVDTLSVGVDRIQRNFEPLQRQVETWRKTQITDATAKLIFYTAFIDGKLEAPRSLLPEVHRLYFEPEYPEFLGQDHVEFVERLHQCLQEARSGAAVQGNSQTGRLSFPAPSIVKIGPARCHTLNGARLVPV